MQAAPAMQPAPVPSDPRDLVGSMTFVKYRQLPAPANANKALLFRPRVLDRKPNARKLPTSLATSKPRSPLSANPVKTNGLPNGLAPATRAPRLESPPAASSAFPAAESPGEQRSHQKSATSEHDFMSPSESNGEVKDMNGEVKDMNGEVKDMIVGTGIQSPAHPGGSALTNGINATENAFQVPISSNPEPVTSPKGEHQSKKSGLSESPRANQIDAPKREKNTYGKKTTPLRKRKSEIGDFEQAKLSDTERPKPATGDMADAPMKDVGSSVDETPAEDILRSAKRKSSEIGDTESPGPKHKKSKEVEASKKTQGDKSPASSTKGSHAGLTGKVKKPDAQRSQKKIMKGFPNNHNWCYRNAAIQILAGSEDLRIGLAEHAVKHNANPIVRCAACTLGRILGDHICDEGEKDAINQRIGLENKLRRAEVLDAPFKRYKTSQEDSAQYMLSLVSKVRDHLQEPIKKSMTPEQKAKNLPIRDDVVSKILYGQINSVITCGGCKHRSVTTHDLPSLTVQPQRPQNRRLRLEDSLEAYFMGTVVSDYKCEKCHRKGKTRQTHEFVKIPQYFLIDMPRWERPPFGKFGHKSKLPVDFPMVLTLEENGKEVEYHFKGMIGHQGPTMSGGHYMSYVQAPSGRWKLCDDRNVIDVNEGQLRTCHGNSMQATAFAYQRAGEPRGNDPLSKL